MMGQFHNSHILIGIDPCNSKIVLDEMGSIVLVETITALKLLNCCFRPIGLIGSRIRSDLYGLRSANQRAAQLVDDQVGAVRVGLCMSGLLNSQSIAGILYQSMLKAPSGSQKRPPIFAAKLNGPQGTFYALIGAARSPPECVESL